jgi:hypothetical protein
LEIVLSLDETSVGQSVNERIPQSASLKTS